MKNSPLNFPTAAAVSVGGSYVVEPETGAVVRQDGTSTDLQSIARGAQVANGTPGPAAELKAAVVGAAPALPEAPGVVARPKR